MLIISKEHDYYDCIQGQGIDKSVVYKRETREVDRALLKAVEIVNDYNRICLIKNHRGVKLYIERHIVGFCGKWYFCTEVRKEYETGRSKSSFCYDIESLRDITRKEKSLADHLRDGKVYGGYVWGSYSERSAETTYRDVGKLDDIEPFITYSSPILVPKWGHGRRYLEVDSILKNYQFFKVMDPYTAFQEISMFISGVLGNTEVDTVDISDEDMKAEKGFYKWSFKKMPGEKKPRRKGKK